jgi:putative NADPH-quinone reductase
MRRCSARRVKRLRVRGMRSQRPIFRRCFDPVSSRKNFTTVKDPSYFKQQVEEMYATEVNGFAEDIESEIRKLESCDLMIWQFPLWWFGLPAALKGWVDRVFALGRTYGGGRYYETGIFRGKRALLSLTTGGQEDAYRKGGLNGIAAKITSPGIGDHREHGPVTSSAGGRRRTAAGVGGRSGVRHRSWCASYAPKVGVSG